MAGARARRLAAQVVGVALLVPTLVFVLGFSSRRWTFKEECDVAHAESQALFNYMSFYSCAQVLPPPLKALLLLVWLVLLISLLASTADNFFMPQLEAMAQVLGLPEDVAGVTLLALGNGMPDVMTATSSINNADDFVLTMGEFFGAANFILSLVLGCVLLAGRGPANVEAAALLRDSMSYLLVLALVVAVTWDGYVKLVESLLFFVVYVAYVLVVVLPGRLHGPRATPQDKRQSPIAVAIPETCPLMDGHAVRTELVTPCWKVRAHTGDAADGCRGLRGVGLPVHPGTGTAADEGCADGDGGASAAPSDASTEFVLLESDTEEASDDEGDPLEGISDAEAPLGWLQLMMEWPFTVARHVSIPAAHWNHKRRILAAACPICSVLVMLLSFGGWEAFDRRWGVLPVWLCYTAAGALGALGVIAGSSPRRRPRFHVLLLVLALVCTIAWFNLFANECVAVLETFGITCGISSSVLGITVLAWGNSVGDFVADLALVRKGRTRMAVAGCFGSPLLSELLGLGVALTSYNVSNGGLHVALSAQNKIAACFVLLSVLSTVTAFGWSRFCCPRRFGYVLLAQYAMFMAVSVLAETGALDHRSAP